MGRAGCEQRLLVGEVAVQGGPSHARALGDSAERGAGGADRPVQLHGALGDAPAGLGLELGSAPLFVFALFVSHRCPTNIDTSGRSCDMNSRDTTVPLKGGVKWK